MNTADRSLAMVDYALRRRFAFGMLQPKIGSDSFRKFLESKGIKSDLVDLIVLRMGQLNESIANDTVNLGPGFCIGHSFFCPTGGGGAVDSIWYQQVIETEIVPLLEEYWFDDQERVEEWRGKLLADL